MLVRFMKAMAQTYRWIYQNREPMVDHLAREMKLKPEHARRGWEFYATSRMWYPDGDLDVAGLQVVRRSTPSKHSLRGPYRTRQIRRPELFAGGVARVGPLAGSV